MKMRVVICMEGVPNPVGHIWRKDTLQEMVADYPQGQLETIGGRLCLTAVVDVPLMCAKCDGCGQVADTEDQEPWSRWKELPMQAGAAVLLGLVKPKTCPACQGTGKV